MMDGNSEIVDFFNNRSIFITGATGFVGKATVEKLLRSCHSVKNVYILIRAKRGVEAPARLNQLLESSIYDTLRRDNPTVFTKIIPVIGDITLPNLGIGDQDLTLLSDQVSLVVHSAATVKFDENLKLAANINIGGTCRIIDLCKRLPRLAALVHISTAYSNCDQMKIEEVIYPTQTDPYKLLQCTEWMDDSMIAAIAPKLLGEKPNTYTYTKALAEKLLIDASEYLPVCIIRPSIVTATCLEPVAGWIDNLNGPTGIIVAYGKGLLRTILCHRKMVADLVPLDLFVNFILVASWHTAKTRPTKPLVYNFCSGEQNPFRWGEFEKLSRRQLMKHPMNNVAWYPCGTFKSNQLWNTINDFFLHTIPAILIDLVLLVVGKKPIMMNLYKKIAKATRLLQFFAIRNWTFCTENKSKLYQTLSTGDKKLFNFNIKEVNWPNFIDNYCLGVRKYVLKEDCSTLPAARKHLEKMHWIHRFVQFCLIMLVYAVLVTMQILPNMFVRSHLVVHGKSNHVQINDTYK